MDRNQLIEDAAKAIYEHSETDDEGVICLGCDEVVNNDLAKHQAEIVLAVFEGAHTPTDDERARMVAFFRRMVPIIHEPLATQVAEEWVDMFLKEFGFRRTVQGEPTPDGWFAFGSHAPYPWVGHLEFSDEKDEGGMPLWERPVQGELAPEKRMLMTHPHDGHGPNDTCRKCVQGEPSDAQVNAAVDTYIDGRLRHDSHEAAMRAALRAAAETGGER